MYYTFKYNFNLRFFVLFSFSGIREKGINKEKNIYSSPVSMLRPKKYWKFLKEIIVLNLVII